MGENSGSHNADGMEWGEDPRNPDYKSRFYGGFCRKAQSVGDGKSDTWDMGQYSKPCITRSVMIRSRRFHQNARRTTCYRSVNEHHMRPEWETTYKIERRRLKGRADPSNQGRTLRSHQNVRMDSCQEVYMRVLIRMTASRVSCVALIHEYGTSLWNHLF